jgi:hypothetical protein
MNTAVYFAKLIPQSISAAKVELERADKARLKAGETAVRVEGFRLQQKLKKQIASGSVDGTQHAPLSMIARHLSKSTKPGRKLATAIRYDTVKAGNNFAMVIGFLHGSKKLSSKSWVRIATVFQQGKSWEPSSGTRRWLAWRGIGMTARSKYRKFFFIKKTTQAFKTPPRPIITPFWESNKAEAAANRQQNYLRKMAGERI